MMFLLLSSLCNIFQKRKSGENYAQIPDFQKFFISKNTFGTHFAIDHVNKPDDGSDGGSKQNYYEVQKWPVQEV